LPRRAGVHRDLDIEPVNDYAQYGVGLCRVEGGTGRAHAGNLRLATVMRPDNADYQAALGAGHRR